MRVDPNDAGYFRMTGKLEAISYEEISRQSVAGRCPVAMTNIDPAPSWARRTREIQLGSVSGGLMNGADGMEPLGSVRHGWVDPRG